MSISNLDFQVCMGAHILGDFRTQHIGLPQSYFEERDCWVDCREPGMLKISAKANIGWCVRLVSQTHDVMPGMFGRLTGRPIVIEDDVFIGAFATLYNCKIGKGAVVAVGSVVRSQDVAPYTMVAGNPAQVIKVYDHILKQWVSVSGQS